MEVRSIEQLLLNLQLRYSSMTLIARAVCYMVVRGHFFTGGAVYHHLMNANPTGIRAPTFLNITPDTETEIGCLKTPPRCKMDGICFCQKSSEICHKREQHLNEGHEGPQGLSKRQKLYLIGTSSCRAETWPLEKKPR